MRWDTNTSSEARNEVHVRDSTIYNHLYVWRRVNIG